MTYRTKSSASTTIDSNIIVTQTIPDPGLSLAVSTIDSFQPETLVVAAQYRGQGWRVGGSIEQQNWSELEDEFASDTIKDQQSTASGSRIQFDDILVPRLGAEYELNRNFAVRTGLASEESPLKSTRRRGHPFFPRRNRRGNRPPEQDSVHRCQQSRFLYSDQN
ncbi:hypothetical protein BKP64_12795 [Marinobacter salinus]|uniref:Uncharacterized protein n=1 Tax=Marinobacter salinus TaxID=1874317 RepID=A0A1D9GNK7_9GAMM|nr:outer membrane protein transport protein [Marinobacter salinus]AOY88970.1 hypothetical protein BKP64_12795 [Marinobacter salinus]